MDMPVFSQRPVPSLSKREFFSDPSLPLQVHFRDPQPTFPRHKHGFDELVIIMSGRAVHEVDGQEFPVRGGDVFVVTPSQEHEYLDMHRLVLANILFDSRALEMDRWDIRALPGFHALFSLEPAYRSQHHFQSRLRLSESQLVRASTWVRDLASEASGRNPGYRVMAQGLFMQLVVFLSRCYSEKQGKESRDLLRIGEAIAHIETHYADKIHLEELARMAYLSARQFQRVFRTSTGHSPIDYLRHVRVRKAADRLRQTDHSLTRIAFDCGFSDSNYFIRCFRDIMGQTPRRYRGQG